jgi:hypothetical protein
MLKESDSPTWPPNTKPPHTAQQLRKATRPLATGKRCWSVLPLMIRTELGNPMKGMNPDPDAFLQSPQ